MGEADDTIATHMLVFLVWGIQARFQFPVANYATKTMTLGDAGRMFKCSLWLKLQTWQNEFEVQQSIYPANNLISSTLVIDNGGLISHNYSNPIKLSKSSSGSQIIWD